MAAWTEVLRNELIDELITLVPSVRREDVRASSAVFAPPPRSPAAPVSFALAREDPAIIDSLVGPPSRRTLQRLHLEDRYAQFKAMTGGPSYSVYQTVGDFHGRLVDRMSAHLRRLALSAAAEAADVDAAQFPDHLGFSSPQTREQFVIQLTKVVNLHAQRTGLLPEASLQKLATAKVFGDAVVAVLPVYSRRLAR